MIDVAIIGGGVAGIACAARLSQSGLKVQLLEARSRLGGRAGSFQDRQTDRLLDLGQHVSMGCCVYLQDLCNTFHADDLWSPQPAMYFVDRTNKIDRLYSSTHLPSPFASWGSIRRAKFLTRRDKRSVSRAIWKLMRNPTYSGGSFFDWLIEQKQSEELCNKFWKLLLVSTLNDTLDRIDYRYARQVFMQGVVGSSIGSQLILPAVTLQEIYHDQGFRYLNKNGIQIRFNTGVKQIEIEDREDRKQVKRLKLTNDEMLEAKQIVVAVPHMMLFKILPGEVIEQYSYFSNIDRIETSPITSFHFLYDRPVMKLPHLGLIDRFSHWIFNIDNPSLDIDDRRKTGAKVERIPSRIQVVISASRDVLEIGTEQAIERVKSDLKEVLPFTNDAKLLDVKPVTEKHATFCVTPGIDELRPASQSPIENLILAGDYVQTYWPSTMEGATRSGYQAANRVLQQTNRQMLSLPKELRIDWPLRPWIKEPYRVVEE